MKMKEDNPYAGLKRVFHEPSRLAIVSILCAAADGATFNDLKAECELTDGNLSRHLKTLEDAGMIRISKNFVGVKPQTTVYLSDNGRDGFLTYLQALETVLQKAASAVGPEAAEIGLSLTIGQGAGAG